MAFGGMSSSLNEEAAFRKNFNMTYDFFDLIGRLDNEESEEELADCMKSVMDLGQSYKAVHGYIALIICVFGTVANILNLIVLKEMSSPINRMLTALAFADMLVMLEYIPFAIHMYIVPGPRNFSYHWTLFVLFHSHFTQVFHTISIQLTLTMAIWRYVAIRCSHRSSSYCTFKRCNLCILASYTCPFILCIPNYLTFAIYHSRTYFLEFPFGTGLQLKPGPTKEKFLIVCAGLKNPNCTNAIRQIDRYVVDLSEMAKAQNGLLGGINFWIYSVFIKLIPCVVLTVFMCWLLNTLYKAKRHHTMLQKNASLGMRPINTTAADGVAKEHSSCNGNGLHTVATCGELIDQDPHSNMPSCGQANGNGRQSKVGFHAFPTLLRKSSPKPKSCKRSDKTSKMLVAVLFLFLLTEFPQGIMAFLSGFYGQEFFRHCYNAWAEVWDILALFNSAVNFVLYCFMSRQFRLQFQQLFKLHSPKWIATCNTTVSTTV